MAKLTRMRILKIIWLTLKCVYFSIYNYVLFTIKTANMTYLAVSTNQRSQNHLWRQSLCECMKGRYQGITFLQVFTKDSAEFYYTLIMF